MRFDGDRPQVRDETCVARHTASCVWLRRWKHCSFKGALFFRLTDPTADMPFIRCYEERRYAEQLASYIGKLSDSGTIAPVLFALFFFVYAYDRPWFIDELEFR